MAHEFTEIDLLSKILDAIEQNTEKVQELLERVECIDNSMDEVRDNSDTVVDLMAKLKTSLMRP